MSIFPFPSYYFCLVLRQNMYRQWLSCPSNNNVIQWKPKANLCLIKEITITLQYPDFIDEYTWSDPHRNTFIIPLWYEEITKGVK